MSLARQLAYNLINLPYVLPDAPREEISGSNSILSRFQHSDSHIVYYYPYTNSYEVKEFIFVRLTSKLIVKNNTSSLRAWQLLKEREIPHYFVTFPIYRCTYGAAIYISRDNDLGKYLKTYFIEPILPLSLDEIKNQCAQVILGVNELHTHAIAHRDIKANNFLVSIKNNRVHIEIADLNDAIDVNPINGHSKNYILDISTKEYRAPELIEYIRKKTHDERQNKKNYRQLNFFALDIYALGVLLKIYLEIMEKNYLNHTPQYNLFKDLVTQTIKAKANKRITVKEIMLHPFFGETTNITKSFFEHVYLQGKYEIYIDDDPLTFNKIALNTPYYILNKNEKYIYKIANLAVKAIEDCENFILEARISTAFIALTNITYYYTQMTQYINQYIYQPSSLQRFNIFIKNILTANTQLDLQISRIMLTTLNELISEYYNPELAFLHSLVSPADNAQYISARVFECAQLTQTPQARNINSLFWNRLDNPRPASTITVSPIAPERKRLRPN